MQERAVQMGLDETTVANQHKTVHCARHGDRREAFICDHLLSGTRQVFFIDSDDVANPHPDAWCLKCERIRLAHGGKWNETSEALIKVRLVCGDCYEEIKGKNVLGTEGIKSVQ
jgi:molybdenum cofactor biosynthesis enzyme MoaA